MRFRLAAAASGWLTPGVAGFLLWLSACDPGTVHVARYPGGRIKESWTEKGPPEGPTVREGTFTSFYPDGREETAVEYRGGRKHGKARFRRADGRLAFQGRYQDDFLIAETRWDEAGRRTADRAYRVAAAPVKALGPDGDSLEAVETCAWTRDAKPVRHGLCRIAYSDGLILSTRYFHAGKLQGPVKAWYANGARWMEGAYDGNLPTGVWRTWSRQGKPIWTAGYARGLRDGPSQEWFPDGKPKSKGLFRRGKQEGKYQEWYPNGNLRLLVVYADGKRTGTESAWYPNGSRLYAAGYADGRLEGDFRQWHPGGRPRLQCGFRAGRKHGPSRVWNPEGVLLEEGFYRDGRLNGTYRSWTPEGELLVTKQFREGQVASDSKAAELLDLLGAGQVRVPVGLQGFYWGMTPKECRANLSLLQPTDIRAGKDEIAARVLCFRDRRPTPGRIRLLFNLQGELWGVKLDLLQEGSGDFFTLCDILEQELGTELGTAGLRKDEGGAHFQFTRKKDWGRFHVSVGAENPIRQDLPVVSAEGFSPGGRGWFRFALSNHLYREYVNPANSAISPPEWPEQTYLAGS